VKELYLQLLKTLLNKLQTQFRLIFILSAVLIQNRVSATHIPHPCFATRNIRFYIQIFKVDSSPPGATALQENCQAAENTRRRESIVIHWKHKAVLLFLLCLSQVKNTSSREEK
jgi:hypothetical protein